jgi:hypothetical protein
MSRKNDVQEQPTEELRQKKQGQSGKPPAQSNRRDRQNKLGSTNQTMERQKAQRSTGNA